MRWRVEYHGAFVPEVESYPLAVRQKLIATATILSLQGPLLGRPYVDTLKGSRHSNMKELRFDAGGGVWRVAFAFDPERKAILLVGGDKSGDSQSSFYQNLIRIADERFDQHQKAISEAGGKKL